jgi:hypothetical protein
VLRNSLHEGGTKLKPGSDFSKITGSCVHVPLKSPCF